MFYAMFFYIQMPFFILSQTKPAHPFERHGKKLNGKFMVYKSAMKINKIAFEDK